MVRLDHLNRECVTRPVSRAVPAQIACRVLGNETGPCKLDPVCRPAGKHGVWLFYTSLAGAVAGAFIVVWWLMRVTRLSRLLGVIIGLLWPPIQWIFSALWRLKTAWDDIFF